METWLENDKLLSILQSIKEQVQEEVTTDKIEKRTHDVHTLYLNGIIENIKKLESDVDSFKNPGQHFSKQYQVLERYCEKIQNDLEDMDCTGREKLRGLRRKALKDISKIQNTLIDKGHENGAACPDCEVK